MMKLSVVVVSWNTKDLLEKCLKSLYIELESTNITSEVFVIDNNSADGSSSMVSKQFPNVRLIANPDNKGFGRANNQALRKVTGEYILLLNPDTEVLPNAISSLLVFAEQNSKVGIVAPQLLNTDGSIQRSCRAFPSLSGMFYEIIGLSRLFPKAKKFREYKMLDFDHKSTREVDQPEGACLLIPKAVLEEVGIFDEKFFMLFEEVDLCLRIKQAGYQIWFYPESKIIHHYGQSIKKVKVRMMLSSHKGMYYFWSKHHQRWYHKLARPLLWFMLAGLLVFRIIIYYLRKII